MQGESSVLFGRILRKCALFTFCSIPGKAGGAFSAANDGCTIGEQFVNDTGEILGDRMNLIGALWVIPLALILLAVAARRGPDAGRQQARITHRR